MDFEISNIGIVTAVAAGAVSFLSPCVLPLVPGYVSYIAGNSRRGPEAAAPNRLGVALRAYSYEAGIVGGALVILFGVFMTGLVKLPWLQRDVRYHGNLSGGGPLGAYLLGLAFAFGWTPCIGPILGAILTVSAVSATATDGIVLLSLYSLGLGIPFLLAAVFTQTLMGSLPRMPRAGRVLQITAGGIMILMGLAMMTGQMTRFAFWLLERFPAFGSIG